MNTVSIRRPAAMTRLLVVLTAAISLLAFAPTANAAYPNSMASTGDSITRAFNTCSFPFSDCVANSWSTGTSSTVNSHYRRILAANGTISGKNANYAVSGAKIADLPGQVGKVTQEYVTILMGANDACTSSESTMTSVASYSSYVQQAIDSLKSRVPNTKVAVISIPDVYQLWNIFKNNSSARNAWSFYGICQSLLANPTSTLQADVDRRARVRQRVIDFNTAAKNACATHPRCTTDNNAAFNLQFTTSDVSTRDYFHPSVAGQTKAASTTWNAVSAFVSGP